MAVIIRFDLDVSKMTRQGGCWTTVVVRNEIMTHLSTKTEKGLRLYRGLSARLV